MKILTIFTKLSPSTSEKPEHIYDLAFQTFVLEKAGLKIRNQFIICVNNEYVKDGEINPVELCNEKDITESVRENILVTQENIEKAKKVLLDKNIPSLSIKYLNDDIGEIEEWKKIYQNVNGEFPKYSIYNMCYLNKEFILRCERDWS